MWGGSQIFVSGPDKLYSVICLGQTYIGAKLFGSNRVVLSWPDKEGFRTRLSYRVFIKIVFSPRILKSLPPLPRQNSAVIGCTINYQPIGVTMYTRTALRVLKVSYSDVGKGGVAVNCEKTQFIHPVY